MTNRCHIEGCRDKGNWMLGTVDPGELDEYQPGRFSWTYCRCEQCHPEFYEPRLLFCLGHSIVLDGMARSVWTSEVPDYDDNWEGHWDV